MAATTFDEPYSCAYCGAEDLDCIVCHICNDAKCDDPKTVTLTLSSWQAEHYAAGNIVTMSDAAIDAMTFIVTACRRALAGDEV